MHFVPKQWKGIHSVVHTNFCYADCVKSCEKVNSYREICLIVKTYSDRWGR